MAPIHRHYAGNAFSRINRYHASSTGAEILRDFAGKSLVRNCTMCCYVYKLRRLLLTFNGGYVCQDYWVTGYGTGGTFAGAGSVIKAARPDTKIVLTEPSVAPLVQSGEVQDQGLCPS